MESEMTTSQESTATQEKIEDFTGKSFNEDQIVYFTGIQPNTRSRIQILNEISNAIKKHDDTMGEIAHHRFLNDNENTIAIYFDDPSHAETIINLNTILIKTESFNNLPHEETIYVNWSRKKVNDDQRKQNQEWGESDKERMVYIYIQPNEFLENDQQNSNPTQTAELLRIHLGLSQGNEVRSLGARRLHYHIKMESSEQQQQAIRQGIKTKYKTYQAKAITSTNNNQANNTQSNRFNNPFLSNANNQANPNPTARYNQFSYTPRQFSNSLTSTSSNSNDSHLGTSSNYISRYPQDNNQSPNQINRTPQTKWNTNPYININKPKNNVNQIEQIAKRLEDSQQKSLEKMQISNNNQIDILRKEHRQATKQMNETISNTQKQTNERIETCETKQESTFQKLLESNSQLCEMMKLFNNQRTIEAPPPEKDATAGSPEIPEKQRNNEQQNQKQTNFKNTTPKTSTTPKQSATLTKTPGNQKRQHQSQQPNTPKKK
jgi:hypothetical protein